MKTLFITSSALLFALTSITNAAAVGAAWNLTGASGEAGTGITATTENINGTPTLGFNGGTGFATGYGGESFGFTAFDSSTFATGGNRTGFNAADFGSDPAPGAFTVSFETFGAENFVYQFDYRSNGNALLAGIDLTYSINNGSATSVGSLSALNNNNTEQTFSYDLSSISAIENIASGNTVQLTFSWTNLTTSTGAAANASGFNNYRFDNIQVTGVAIPEPSSFALLAGALGLAMVLLRHKSA